MHQSNVPQYTVQIGALWDICLLYFGICEMGLSLKYTDTTWIVNYQVITNII